MLGIGLGSWCLTPLLTIIQLYRGGQFLLLEETEYRRKLLTCRKSLRNLII